MNAKACGIELVKYKGENIDAGIDMKNKKYEVTYEVPVNGRGSSRPP